MVNRLLFKKNYWLRNNKSLTWNNFYPKPKPIFPFYPIKKPHRIFSTYTSHFHYYEDHSSELGYKQVLDPEKGDLVNSKKPNKLKIKTQRICQKPNLLRIQRLLSIDETNFIIETGKEHGLSRPRNLYTSAQIFNETWVGRDVHPILDTIHRRISDVLKIDESYFSFF